MTTCEDNRTQYIPEEILLPGVRRVRSADAATDYEILNVAFPTPNTEFSFTLPAGTKRFSCQARINSRFDILESSGGAASLRVKVGNSFDSGEVLLDAATTIYVKSPKGGDVLEVFIWT